MKSTFVEEDLLTQLQWERARTVNEISVSKQRIKRSFNAIRDNGFYSPVSSASNVSGFVGKVVGLYEGARLFYKIFSVFRMMFRSKSKRRR